MANESVTMMPAVRAGRRGQPVACDCCGSAICTGDPYHWSEVEVGPASFAWATCGTCSESEKAKELSWLEKAVTRARRYRPSWAKAAERMMMDSLN